MKRFRFETHGLPLVVVFVVLCAAAICAAEEELVWPVNIDLVYHDGNIAEVWHSAGGVSIWNTKDDLKIAIVPNGFKIEEVAIHIVLDPADVPVDKYGKPKISKFEYKTDYLGDEGILAENHLEVIPLDDLPGGICWGVNPETCPPNRYIVVAVELDGVSETAFAENGGAFDRFDHNNTDAVWGWYVTYPLAKVEPGHFIDANVSGLAYATITQSGVTGEEGQFWFLPDERIDFSVGSLPLGDALGDRRVSPVDLFPGSDMDDDRVINVAWLLQSLDGDGNPAQGSINITETEVACLENGMASLGISSVDFADETAVFVLIAAARNGCPANLADLTRTEAWENLKNGQKAGNLMKKNVSKTPGMKSDKAKIEIMPVYVPAQTSDGYPTEVVYHDAEGDVIESRSVAKPIVVSYLDEVEGTDGASDVFVAISRDDGETWKRRNISKTAGKSSFDGTPGESQKPMLKVKDNMIFVAWTDKYCRGGRPGYAINLCDDPDTEAVETPETGCAEYCTGNPLDGTEVCTVDYPGDDPYWKDDLFGVSGPQRSVTYDEYPEMGEVGFSCVWTARGVVDPANGEIEWFKPERLTSGRRDAFQLFAGAGEDVAFAIVWQEDPKGLRPGEGDGPGEGWSGANTHNKTDIWYSYITLADFAKIDYAYPAGGHGDNDDLVDTDDELAGRVKALVPMSLPVRVTDNDVCSAENMDPDGGNGEHDYDGEGQGTHRYCGTLEGIGTAAEPGSNPLCTYTIEKTNPRGEIHNVCVTADGRFLDGNTGASRPNIFLQPYKKGDGSKSAWAIIGYEESKGVGIPPEGEHDDDDGGCSHEEVVVTDVTTTDEHDDDRYKPDMGKNVIYHSFDFANPKTVDGGGIINLPETDAAGNTVYVLNEDSTLFLDWKGDPVPATENARRVRFIPQAKSKAGNSGTVLVALYRQGEEGSGKPADIFMRRMVSLTSGNPYTYGNFVPGAQNVSSVTATLLWQHPFDAEKPEKMLRWGWSEANLADKSGTNPRDDARAHRGALNGDELIIGYTWTPNWGRKANDTYDFLVRRSFNGGQGWTTDPKDSESIEHNVAFRVPIVDEVNREVTWTEEVVTTVYGPGAPEPPRIVSNLRNNRISVLEPRLVKTPGTILTDGFTLYPEDKWDKEVYQLAYGIEFNQNQLPDDVVYPKIPLDIDYSRTTDKGQRFESVVVTPQSGSGKPQEGWSPLAKDKPQQGAAQLRQTPDGSRMYSVWLEESDSGSDIMFRRVDYR